MICARRSAVVAALLVGSSAALVPSTSSAATVSAAPPPLLVSWPTPGTFTGGQFAVAVDRERHVYVSHVNIPGTSNYQTERFAGDGTPLNAWPTTGTGVAAAPDGSIYSMNLAGGVASIGKYSSAGVLQSSIPLPPPSAGVSGTSSISALATDTSGNLYATDAFSDRVFEFAPSGALAGTITDPAMLRPVGVGVDPQGDVFVLDDTGGGAQVLKFAPGQTSSSSTTFSGLDDPQGPLGGASEDVGSPLAVDGTGHVYVTDLLMNRVVEFDNAGNYVTQWSTVPPSGKGRSYPSAVAVDQVGDVYVIAGTQLSVYGTSPPSGTVVTPVAPTLTWPAPNAATYGTTISAAQLNAAASDPTTGAPVPGSYTYTLDGGTADPTGTVPAAGPHTLAVTFTPTDTVHHTAASASTPFTVQPATLTVTADPQSRLFGQPNPPLTATITGYVPGGTGPATGQATCQTTATISSSVAGYPITCSQGTLAAPNYTFAFQPGTLTVQASRAITTPITGPVTVASGQVLLIGNGGVVRGPVLIAPGGALDVEGGTVSGPLAGLGASALRLCGAAVTGALGFAYATGPVVIGDRNGCAANSLTAVALVGNRGGLGVTGNTITGGYTAIGNTGGYTYSSNTVLGPIRQSGNG